MYIKADKESFAMLLQMLPADGVERLAMVKFRSQNIIGAGFAFAMADVSLKIARGLLGFKKKITLTNAEACAMLYWCAEQEKEKELEHAYYAQNVVRQVKISLHQQLTNYQSKY